MSDDATRIERGAERLVNTSVDDAHSSLALWKQGDNKADLAILQRAVELERAGQNRSAMVALFKRTIRRLGGTTATAEGSTPSDWAPAVRAGNELAASVQHIRELHGEIMEHMRAFAEKVVLCGFELLALKRQVGHGRWLKFCDSSLYTEGFSERHTRRYMEVALAIRTKMRLLNDGDGMEEIDRGVLDMEKVREALADTTNATSWRQLWMDLGLMRNPKPRGGDHGGGVARAEQFKRDAADLDFSLANEQWNRIVEDISNFAAMSRHAHIHPAALSAGVTRIKECLAKITKEA